MATAYDKVTERLQIVTGYSAARPGADWRCPNTTRHTHGDKRPSLSVTPAPDRVLIHCQTGCSIDEVLGALELSKADLFDQVLTNGNGNSGPVAVYPYTDHVGDVLFEVVRYTHKKFLQRTPDAKAREGFRWGTKDVAYKPPYHLPALIDAVGAGRRVWVVEGERDVEALERAGEAATCNPGGAGNWSPTYARFFTGADVFVVVDKDEPGRLHAVDVVKSLTPVAKSIRVVEAAQGKDSADHLSGGLGVDEFVWADIDEPRSTATSTAADDQNPGTLTPTDAEIEPQNEAQRPISAAFTRTPLDISTKPVPREMIGKYLYKAGLTVFQAEAGVGKSWLALRVALDIIASGGVVLYFDEEGGEDLMRERLYALGASQRDVTERFWFFPFEARSWTPGDVAALEALIEEAEQVGPVTLAVFDSLPDFLAAAGLSENDAKDITTFVNKVCGVLRSHGIAQATLDHLVKPPADGGGRKERSRYSRGSGAKLAKADATILLEVAEPFDSKRSGRLRLWKTKDRYGRLDVPRLDEPGLILDVTVGDDGSVTIGESLDLLPEWSGPRECMSAVVELLRVVGDSGLTSNAIDKNVGYRRVTVLAALEQLAKEDFIRFKGGPRNSVLWYLDEGIEQKYLDLIQKDDDVF